MKKTFVTLLIILLATLFVPSVSFAATVEVIGNVVDSSSMPVAQTRIIFQNAESQQISTTASFNGGYAVSLPAGTYTVTVIPPSSSGIAQMIQTNQTFESNGIHNITIASQLQSKHQQQNNQLIILGGVLVLLAGGIIYFLLRKR